MKGFTRLKVTIISVCLSYLLLRRYILAGGLPEISFPETDFLEEKNHPKGRITES